MSASDVIVQLPISCSSSRPATGSKIVATIGTSAIEVAHQQRGAQRPRVVARDDGDGVRAALERLAQLLRAAGSSSRMHVGAVRRAARRRLVGEIAGAEQEDAPWRHAVAIYRWGAWRAARVR